MPVITVANTKGGSGKSNTAFALGLRLADRGATVGFVDADPQMTITEMLIARLASHGIAGYADAAGNPLPAQHFRDRFELGLEGITVYPWVTEDDIIERIDMAAQRNDFVFVDLQGTANNAMLLAIQRADFVLVPANPGRHDLRGFTRAYRVLQNARAAVGRPIAAGVLLVRTGASVIGRNVDKHARAILEGLDIDAHRFATELCQRAAIEEMTYTGSLPDPDRPGGRQTLENIDAVLKELLTVLDAATRAGRTVRRPSVGPSAA